MKKQSIKLNESQLRNIIKEALNELDWKTYASTAWQRNHQTTSKTDPKRKNLNARSIKLIDAARKEFNKKFGNGDYEALFNQEPTTGFFDLNTCDKKHWYKQGYDDDYKLHTYPMGFDIDPNTISDTAKQGNQEIDDFIQGKYDYTPGKGWHLKESQLRNIIKESIKNVLNEGISIKEYLDSLPKGSIIDNKRVLALLKRKGLIYDYSPWGYLECAYIEEVDENGKTTWSTRSYLFPNGNAPKNGRLTVPESEGFISDQDIEFMGNTFNRKYLDGCFNAYLQKTSGNEEGAVNPRGSLWGNIY